ncbi:DUF1016 N-terminal domain-containing protein [uncultured Aquimonas sp.]|uniref:DUF1016 N-terminal domain-containing protein n=1 Tax=uncultured Aquimonas sp. TaxID=385483 RepID=UPI0026325974|nr:DUF1016 N-terminal domain-containing protein [uncultured Aquimonas sp.]
MSIRKTAKKTAVAHRDSRSGAAADVPVESAFGEVVDLIRAARQRAHQAVNTELIGLYWQIGEYINGKLAAAEWGEGVVERLVARRRRRFFRGGGCSPPPAHSPVTSHSSK